MKNHQRNNDLLKRNLKKRSKPSGETTRKPPAAAPLLKLNEELSGPSKQPMREFTAEVSMAGTLTLNFEAVDEEDAQRVAESARDNILDSIPMWVHAYDELDRDVQVPDVGCDSWDASVKMDPETNSLPTVLVASKIIMLGEQSLIFLGDDSSAGTYILRISVPARLKLVFGTGERIKVISLEKGEYLYLGSATAKQGTNSLTQQLVRHATRSDGNEPHKIREVMLSKFEEKGLCKDGLLPKPFKRPQTVVDHLLDQSIVNLVRVYVIRSSDPIGERLAQRLENDRDALVFNRAVALNESNRTTTLLRVRGGEVWWRHLPCIISEALNDKEM